jgi:hypothetical protein
MIAKSRIGLHRRLVALVAAYGLVLQAMLSAFAVVPIAAAEAVICTAGTSSHGGTDAPPVPHHPDCTICPLACGGAAVPPPAVAIVSTFHVSEAPPARPVIPSVRPAVLRAGLARAPPA